MTVHTGRLASGPIRRPSTRRPYPLGTRVVRALVLAVALAAVAVTAWGVLTSPRIAHAASQLCDTGRADEPSCVDAIYELGYPA